MKRSHLAAFFLCMFASAAFAATSTRTSFDALKSLSGEWQGKTSDGRAIAVSYKVTSNGSALMSEIHTQEDMISMFHMDGDRLLMTHYCGAGNQPRMSATASPDGKTITFDFLDATNLPSPDAGHMQRLIIHLVDADHHTESWTYADHGKDMTEIFDLRRKK